MTVFTTSSPSAKPNRQQRRQAARLAKVARRGNGAAAPAGAASQESVNHHEPASQEVIRHHITTKAPLQEAVKLHKAGRTHEALQLYRKVLVAQPDRVDALNLSGVANLELNHVGEAVKLLQAAVRLQPSYAEARNNLGNALQGPAPAAP